MEVPVYSQAERDRRWTLARQLMAAEDVDALIWSTRLSAWSGPASPCPRSPVRSCTRGGGTCLPGCRR
jgi:hypothetical protein